MSRATLVVMLFAIACGAKKTGGDDRSGSAGSAGAAGAAGPAGSTAGSAAPVSPPPGSAAPPAGSAAAVPAWKLESQPVELSCGPEPLALPAAAAQVDAGERSLPRARAIGPCRDQASVDAVCKCLAASVESWAKQAGLSAPASCTPAPQGSAVARLVEVKSQPSDPDAVAAGTAFVLVAAHGGTWSAINIVEAAPDVDLTETPRASHGATIAMFETRPRDGATLVWVQSRNQYSETDMGEQDVSGAAALSLCVVPDAADQPPYCHAPIKLAAWEYFFTIAKANRDDACKVRNTGVMSASLDSTGALTVRLDRGVDKAGHAGRYRLDR
jgi:hypothetical protein